MMTTTEFDGESSMGNPLKLDNRQMAHITKLLTDSRLLVPTTFSGDFRNFAFKAGFNRSVDWIHFLKYIVPTTLLHFFPPEARHALIAFSRMCNILFQREIDNEGIEDLKENTDVWCTWLAACVNKKMFKPWVFGLNMHLLDHVAALTKYYGPMIYLAAFNMETTIGQIKRRIKSRKDPGVNTGLVLLESAAAHARERAMRPEGYSSVSETNVLTVEDDEFGYEIWGLLKTLTLKKHNEIYKDNIFLNSINWLYYLDRFYGNDLSIKPDTVLEFGSRLRLPNGTVINCSTRYNPENRHSFFVQLCLEVDTNRQCWGPLEINNRIYFGEVLTYFRSSLDGDYPRLLALVKIYEFVLSEGELFPHKLPSAQIKLKVVSVKSIKALCGRGLAPDDSEYVFWRPERKYQHIPLGRLNLL